MKFLESILRSLFISVFPFIALLMFAYGIIQYYDRGFSMGLLGILIVSAMIVIFFAGLFIMPRARTDANLKSYSTGVSIGLIINIAGLFLGKVSLDQFVSVIVLGIGWILYLKWYSIFTNRISETLRVGNLLVEFKL